ncbi:MAG: hydroxymethylbilane synthase, partial [Pseudomonadota bacterium]
AVHSAKDLETVLPDALILGAFLPREDVRDAFIGRGGVPLSALPEGATVGTASLRRQALIKRARPDLNCAILRGNVQTRLAKLEAGECEATLLALAGLKRLGQEEVATEILDIERFPPALAQGAIAVETRRDDARVRAALTTLNHPATAHAVHAERGFLSALDGSCRTPIAGLATVENGSVSISGLVATPDGAHFAEAEGSGPADDAFAVGHEAGAGLRRRVGDHFFQSWS